MCSIRRFTPEEREAFDFVALHFGLKIDCVCALVITHCEGLTDREKKKIVDDFHSNPETRDMAKFMKKGIFTVGFPAKEDIKPRFWSAMEEDMEDDIKEIKRLIAKSPPNGIIFTDYMGSLL